MHRLLIVICCIAASVFLTGCLEPHPQTTEVNDALDLVDHFTYVKSRAGLCFGVATVLRQSTNGSASMNNIVVAVDCKSVGL